MRLTPLERRALNDLALRTGCSTSDPFACCDRCWSRWLRARLIQHIRRERYWGELDHEGVQRLQRRWQAKDHVVVEVVARLAAGAENLTVLTWAVDAKQPLDDVVTVLRVCDGIARRVPRFAWMSPAATCAPT